MIIEHILKFAFSSQFDTMYTTGTPDPHIRRLRGQIPSIKDQFSDENLQFFAGERVLEEDVNLCFEQEMK